MKRLIAALLTALLLLLPAASASGFVNDTGAINEACRSDNLLSSTQEAEFLALMDEYKVNLEKDYEKKNACWIEKPTANVNLYFGIKPTRQIRFSDNYAVNMYEFESGNTYGLLVVHERIILAWRFPDFKSMNFTNAENLDVFK